MTVYYDSEKDAIVENHPDYAELTEEVLSNVVDGESERILRRLLYAASLSSIPSLNSIPAITFGTRS